MQTNKTQIQYFRCNGTVVSFRKAPWKARARQESKWCKNLSATCTPEYIFKTRKYRNTKTQVKLMSFYSKKT